MIIPLKNVIAHISRQLFEECLMLSHPNSDWPGMKEMHGQNLSNLIYRKNYSFHFKLAPSEY